MIRAAGDPRALQNAVRGVVQSLDKNAPVYSVRTVEELVGRSVAAPRFNTLLLGLFAGVALILTAVGPLRRHLVFGRAEHAADRHPSRAGRADR